MKNRDDRTHIVRPASPPRPRPNGRWNRLWVVPATGEHWAIALGDSVVWVWRHYLPRQRRFQLCLDSIGEPCLHCQHKTGRDQSGYLPVLLLGEQRTMTLSSGAWLNSQSLQKCDGALRGQKLYATRLHSRANGPLRVWLPGDCTDGRRLPQPWDVLAELDVRYGLAQRDLGSAEKPGERAAQ